MGERGEGGGKGTVMAVSEYLVQLSVLSQVIVNLGKITS